MFFVFCFFNHLTDVFAFSFCFKCWCPSGAFPDLPLQLCAHPRFSFSSVASGMPSLHRLAKASLPWQMWQRQMAGLSLTFPFV